MEETTGVLLLANHLGGGNEIAAAVHENLHDGVALVLALTGVVSYCVSLNDGHS